MFANEIKKEITVEAFNLFSKTGVGDYEEMYGFLYQFPSIAKDGGIRLPSLSNLAVANVSTAVSNAVIANIKSPPSFTKGSLCPPQSIVRTGYQQPPPSGPANALGVSNSSIVHTLTTLVRDQGQRATCVAHSVVACVEEYLSHPDLSEQFSYWATKKHGGDPFPNKEGTCLQYANIALMSHGVCGETLWQYNPSPIPGNETQETLGNPSSPAISDATQRKISAIGYRDTSHLSNGKASMLTQKLNNGPVAAAIPVFVDLISRFDNWNWFGAQDHGHVLDPPQFSVVDGGHAICICEYHPSPAAPGGGWFVFKNSWGTQQWNNGSNPPPSGHPRCKAGYGYLSVAYVDEYLWEILSL
jgi:C1A family cysteine protease